MIVATMDDDIQYDIHSPQTLNPEFINFQYSVDGTTTNSAPDSVVNDGAGTYIVTTGVSTPSQTWQITTNYVASKFVADSIGRIMVEMSDIAGISARFYNTGGNVIVTGVFDEVLNVWVCDFSSLDIAKIKAMPEDKCLCISFNYAEPTVISTINMKVTFFKPVTIISPSIILGAIGMVLIIAAIMATPWFPRYVRVRRSY